MVVSKVLDIKGNSQGEIKLSDDIFGVSPNEHIVHSVVVAYLSNQRKGTASTKTRGEVSGGGVKPWRQKGTGRARVGSIRSPLWDGGGVVFGPKPRDYSIDIPKKMKKIALKVVLSQKFRENKITILDTIDVSEPKTKIMSNILKSLKIEGKTLIVDDEPSKNLILSSRNLEGVKLVRERDLNVYDILLYKNLIFTKKALMSIEERLKS